MNLIQTIEEFDPGHFKRRENYLMKLHKKFIALGFFPLRINESDILCYQLTFEDKRVNNRGVVVGTSISVDNLEDLLENPDGSFMQTVKEVLRYDGTK
jgi:hypothetical protein